MKHFLLIFSVLTATACAQSPSSSSPLFAPEELFADSTYQLVGVAVSRSGRLFSNYMGGRANSPYSVVEIVAGRPIPYPDDRWNAEEGDNLDSRFVRAQAVTVDAEDYLWVVDPGGRPAGPGAAARGQKIVKIDLNTNQVVRVYPLAEVAGGGCMLNDMRVDTRSRTAYISNSGSGGLVVVDLDSGRARHVLEGSAVTQADTSYVFRSGGVPLKRGDRPYRTNTDGIALSPDGQLVYFKALSDDRLFRIPAAALRDFSLGNAELERRVEFLGHFCTTDGMEFDSEGNLYMGDLENRRIVRIDKDLAMTTVLGPDRDLLPWPDSYQMQGDWLYVSCSRIDDQPQFHGGVRQPGYYKIFRFRVK